MSLYSIAVYALDPTTGKRTKRVLNRDWRMSFHAADTEASRMTRNAYGDRTYAAVNCKELDSLPDDY